MVETGWGVTGAYHLADAHTRSAISQMECGEALAAILTAGSTERSGRVACGAQRLADDRSASIECDRAGRGECFVRLWRNLAAH